MEGWIWIFYEGGPKDGRACRLQVVFTGRCFRFTGPEQPDAWYRLTGRYRPTKGGAIPVAEYAGAR